MSPTLSPLETVSEVTFDGRKYPLLLERYGWRLRSKAKNYPVNYRTGTRNLKIAQQRAREWLTKNDGQITKSRRGGGTLAALAKIYLATPKRTKINVAESNVSRMRTVCGAVLGRALEDVTCREVGPKLWQDYQRKCIEDAGFKFDLATRRRGNIAINACTRAARCLFLPALLRVYKAAGLGVNDDAGFAQTLPEPYLPPSTVDDTALVAAWRALDGVDLRMWLTIGLARFGGLRREEIACARVGWIIEEHGAVWIAMRDRPEEQWWSKTGKPYRAEIIEPTLAIKLQALRKEAAADAFIVPDPADDRSRWFERVPQAWLRAHGVGGVKPLHRMRGLFADHIALLTQDAITARLAAIKKAQESLGHTTSDTTKDHYLTPGALR